MADPDSENDETTEHEDTESDGEEYEVGTVVTREEGAAALRRLADGIANGSVELGQRAVSVSVPEQFEIEIEYEQGSDEAEIEAELEWPIVDGEVVSAEQESNALEDEETDEEDEVAAEAAPGTALTQIVGVGETASNARFELFRDQASEWRWRLVHDNGNIIADSGEGYDRIGTARNGLESVMRNAPGARVVRMEE